MNLRVHFESLLVGEFLKANLALLLLVLGMGSLVAVQLFLAFESHRADIARVRSELGVNKLVRSLK